MAKEKASYSHKGNTIFRGDTPVGDVVDNKLVMREGMDNYKLPASKLVKVVIADMVSAPPAEPPEKIEPPTDPIAKKVEAFNGVDSYPKDPVLQERFKKRIAEQHNPFGYPIKDGVPPCPKCGVAGTKTPAVVEWVKEHYPEYYDLQFGAWEASKERRKRREEEKNVRDRRLEDDANTSLRAQIERGE